MLDRTWVALAVALSAWILAAGRLSAASLRASALIAGVTVAALVGRRLGGFRAWAIPGAVASAPIVATAVAGSGLPPGGPLAYPNASAALLFVGAAGALTLYVTSRSRAVRLSSLVLFAVYAAVPWLIASYTAAGVVLLLPVALVVASRGRPTGRTWATIGAVGVVVTLTVTAVLGATYRTDLHPGALDRTLDASVSERRVQLWSDALALTGQHPGTGVGPGGFAQLSPTARAHPDVAVAVHNEYLQLAAETGLPGALLGLALVLFTFVRLAPVAGVRVGAVAVAVVAGLGIHASMDYVLRFPVVPILAAALVGAALAAASYPERRQIADRPAAGSTTVTVVTWALVVLMLVPWGPVNPPLLVPNPAGISDGTLNFPGVGIARSARPPDGLYERLAAANAFTLGIWARTAQVEQAGPARLVSSSRGTDARNVTVAQDGADLIVRLRTSRADLNGTRQEVRVGGVFGDRAWRHVVLVVDGQDVAVHVDGERRATQTRPGGDLRSWDRGYPLLLGNEAGGGRGWLGALPVVAVYDRPLPADEVRAWYSAGTDGALPSGAMAAYVTGPTGDDATITDRSRHRLGGPLTVPSTLRVPPAGLLATATDADQHLPLTEWTGIDDAWDGRSLRILRIVGHVALFGLWALVVVPSWRSRMRARWHTVLAVAVAAGALAVGIEWSQYVAGRSPSVLDLLASVGGATVGALAALRRAVSTRPPA